MAKFGTAKQWQSYLDKTPNGHVGSVEECAKMLTFTASDHASFISGTRVRVLGLMHEQCSDLEALLAKPDHWSGCLIAVNRVQNSDRAWPSLS